MLPEPLAELPIFDVLFTLTPRAEASLPPFVGPGLRGALGHALRLSACPLHCMPASGASRDAGPDCHHRALCAYSTLFDPPPTPGGNAPRPYTLRIEAPVDADRRVCSVAEPLRFGVRLFGGAAGRHIPALVAAVLRMARRGLGAPAYVGVTDADEREAAAISLIRHIAPPQTEGDRAEADALVDRLGALEPGRPTFDVVSVTDAQGVSLYEPASGAPPRIPRARTLGELLAQAPPLSEACVVTLHTPLRLEYTDRGPAGERISRVEEHPTARTLVREALFRLDALGQVTVGTGHGLTVKPLLDAAAALTTREVGLGLTEGLRRRSASQEADMPLDGLLGALELRGAGLGQIAWLLHTAAALHLGKGTVHGLGRLSVE